MSIRGYYQTYTANWLLLSAILLLLARTSFGFVSFPSFAYDRTSTNLHASANKKSSTETSAFPVLEQIAGVNWEGSCRYVNDELIPASFTLSGGVRFDLEDDQDPDGNNESTIVAMNSFVAFPNGKSREIEMRGKRGSLDRTSIRLDSTASDAPIYTVITELYPDTVLINEVDRATGRIVMTSSLSLVTDHIADSTIVQLIQVSHEVAAAKTPATPQDSVIEGHQVWRFSRKDAYQ